MSYKATIRKFGSTDQHLYGTNREKLEVNAIKALTRREPGWGNTYPEKIEVLEKVRDLSGNRAQWKSVGVIYYRDIPEEQLDWLQRKKEKETRLRMAADRLTT